MRKYPKLSFSSTKKKQLITLASWDGGNGRPVITTALPFASAKSRPSLT